MAVAPLSALSAVATDFDFTVVESKDAADKKMYRLKVSNSETGEVVAYGSAKTNRKAKKQANEEEENLKRCQAVALSQMMILVAKSLMPEIQNVARH